MEDVGLLKYSRRTVPIGPQIGDLKAPARFREYTHEVYLREMNISAGGIGCQTWDASVILSNWITQNSHIFYDQRVHEVGAGVGLPAIVAGRYCKQCIASDYVPILLQNMQYNIQLNSRYFNDHEQDSHLITINNEKGYTDTLMPAIEQQMYTQQTQDGASTSTSTSTWRQPGYVTPNLDMVHTNRLTCSNNLQRSTKVTLVDWLEFATYPQEQKDALQSDIMLGSEISYPQNLDTLEGLVQLINETLSPTGVLYVIQSEDRGTEEGLCDHLERLGFEVYKERVPEGILQYYRTGQKLESYHYYTFKRPGSTFPIMKCPSYEETSS